MVILTDILQEIIEAKFRVLNAEILPPTDEEELADLQVIAEKRYNLLLPNN